MHQRRWIDPRDDRVWTVTYNPGVELARPKERSERSRLIFESEDGEKRVADAIYGSDLRSLGDDDLQGLLDQARDEDEGGAGLRDETSEPSG